MLGVDIGGTFTDCVLIGADADGQVTAYRTAKDRGLTASTVHPADLGAVRAFEAGNE